jgi:citrate synthase
MFKKFGTMANNRGVKNPGGPRRAILPQTGIPAMAGVGNDGARNEPGMLVEVEVAAAMLGVKPATIYSYVSRGLIRTAPRLDSHKSLYHREDIDALLLHSRSGVFGGAAAEHAIRWGGGEVLRSSITSIGTSGPRYRDKPAIELVTDRRTFEDCVALLCDGHLPRASANWAPIVLDATFRAFHAPFMQVARPAQWRKLFAMLVQAYSVCHAAHGSGELEKPAATVKNILQVLAPGFGILRTPSQYQPGTMQESIAETIARSAGIACNSEILQAIDASLILSADHELAPSTFVARIAASANADAYSCVASALGAVEGVNCDKAEQLLRRVESPQVYIDRLREYGQRKETIPGYNHPLYVNGDPRASVLLDIARGLHDKPPHAVCVIECIDAAIDQLGLKPGLSLGLVAVAAAIDLPEHAPGALMALARTAGWAAHIVEQRAAGFLVRPRARYIPAE